jgi:RecA/RadA recombinase
MPRQVLTTLQRQRLFAIVIPQGSGKSTVATELMKYKHRNGTSHIFIDLDDFAAKKIKNIEDIVADVVHREVNLFPTLFAEIIKILDSYPSSVVGVLTANPNFVNFMQIKPKRTFMYVPTRDFAKQLYSSLNPSEEELAEIEASREKVIAAYSKAFSMYDSMSALVALITAAFDLILSDSSAPSPTSRNAKVEEERKSK